MVENYSVVTVYVITLILLKQNKNDPFRIMKNRQVYP